MINLPNLPEELIQEILLRLPVKPLMKFKCVSKPWLYLISSDEFAKAHFKISTNNDASAHDKLIFGSPDLNMKLCSCSVSFVSTLRSDIIYCLEDENPVYVDYDELDCPSTEKDEYRWLVGSCNGLVCLLLSDVDIILWNPSTRKFKELPHCSTDYSGYNIYSINHAFGYDVVHDDYKVVQFSHGIVDDVSNFQVSVYSRRSNSWKDVTANWPGGDATFWPSQTLNGAIHWCVWDFDWSIVAQNLATDQFVELPLPHFDDDDDGVDVRKVQIVQGCLALFCGYNSYMDIWLMKEYGVAESWTRVVCIPYFQNIMGSELAQPYPLFIMADGKIIINYGSCLSVYDPSTPRPHRFSGRFAVTVTAATYFESLISPHLDEEAV